MIKQLTGQRFGRLVVKKLHSVRSPAGKARWVCNCDCGKEVIVLGASLGKGSRSCGCLKRDKSITHGKTRTVEYKAWADMKSRCSNSNHKSYANYGGRGIRVCDRWLHSFENFLEDMGKRPTTKHTLDRINNDKNYEPDNCRWVSRLTNNRNRRESKWWFINGVRYESHYHAAEELNIHPSSVIHMCENNPKPNCWTELKYPEKGGVL